MSVGIILSLHMIIIHCVYGIKPPNIVLIVADDLGYNDVGYRGSNQVQTPNIDALAYNGVILQRFYTQATCTPSRAALLTGNYPIRSGMQGIPLRPGQNRSLPQDMPTLPEKLKELGYQTHLVGKWHVGYPYRRVTPIGRGFDTHFGYWNGFVGYFNHSIKEGNMDGLDMHDNFEPAWSSNGVYATDLFTTKAVNIINNNDNVKPLFLMVAHLAPHTGATVGVDKTILEVKNAAEMNRTYDYIKDVNRRMCVDIIKGLDASVGSIIKALSRKRILDNTIIFFMSDNGGQTQGLHENFSSNWPLRGLKFTHFEGGIRGTAVVYNKNLLYKGSINNQLMHITDIFPTFYTAAGGNYKNLAKMDGISQWKTLKYNTLSTRQEILVNIDEAFNYSAIIGYGGQYKLINGSFSNGVYDGYYGESGRGMENPNYDVQAVLNSDTNKALRKLLFLPLTSAKATYLRSKMDMSGCRKSDEMPRVECHEFCLFDLNRDPCELNNIADDHPNVVAELSKKLTKFWRELIPQKPAPVDTNSNPALYDGVWSTWLDFQPTVAKILV